MGLNPYAIRALNICHGCGTKYSTPCCKSPSAISSVPADLHGSKVLSAHLIFVSLIMFGQVPVSYVRYVCLHPGFANPVHHVGHQLPLSQESELQIVPSGSLPEFESTDIRVKRELWKEKKRQLH
jgi:hypothetical protein